MAIISGFRGGEGWQSITPPELNKGCVCEIRGGCTPHEFLQSHYSEGFNLDWNRSSLTTDRLVRLEQVIYNHRQVGQARENGDAPKASISDNSVLNTFISSGKRKLNYRD